MLSLTRCINIPNSKNNYPLFLQTFNNDGMSNYLVVYVRLLTSGQLQQDSDEYLPFVEGLYKDMKEFCDKVISFILF